MPADFNATSAASADLHGALGGVAVTIYMQFCRKYYLRNYSAQARYAKMWHSSVGAKYDEVQVQ
jgi:hypothetical protein